MQKLCRIVSKVDFFPYRGILYDDVIINWSMAGRIETQIPYHEAIENYTQLNSPVVKSMAEHFVKKLFDFNEAQQLKDYLARFGNIETQIETIELPIRSEKASIKISPKADICLLKKENHDIPFEVNGYYEVKGGMNIL
jgi:hypothetical protein